MSAQPGRQLIDLSAIALFDGLDESELDQVRATFVGRTFPRDSVILLEGQPSEGLYVIHTGLVRVFIPHVDGREKTLAHLGPGEILGEMALQPHQPRSASATAVEPTTVLMVSNEDFGLLLSRTPRLALKIVGILSDRLRQADRQIHELTFLNARSRVICSLSQCAGKQGEPGAHGTVVALTHAELAKVAGVSRETATKILNDLEHRRLIRIGRGKLWVLCEDALLDEITQ